MNIQIMKRKMMDSFFEGDITKLTMDEKYDAYSKNGNIWNYSVLSDKLTINLRVFSNYGYSYHIEKSVLELISNKQLICSVPITLEDTLEMRQNILDTTKFVAAEKPDGEMNNYSLAIKLLDEFLNPPKLKNKHNFGEL